MKLEYAYKPKSEDFVAKATGRELGIKFKHAREVCAAIQGMKAQDAVAYLEKVIAKEALVPFKKTKLQGGHKKALKKWPFGKYPVKVSQEVLNVLRGAISNAEFKGLDLNNCVVLSALAQRGRKVPRIKPKGRYALFNVHLTTIQVILEEIST